MDGIIINITIKKTIINLQIKYAFLIKPYKKHGHKSRKILINSIKKQETFVSFAFRVNIVFLLKILTKKIILLN